MWWLLLVPLGLLTDRGFRLRWLLMPAIVILTAIAASLSKLAVRRPRPGSGYRIAPLGRLRAAGFPSTHTACAFAVAGWMRSSPHSRRLHGIAVLIGYWRVHCHAHHPSDVAAGAVLGYGIAWQVDEAGTSLLRRSAASKKQPPQLRDLGPHLSQPQSSPRVAQRPTRGLPPAKPTVKVSPSPS